MCLCFISSAPFQVWKQVSKTSKLALQPVYMSFKTFDAITDWQNITLICFHFDTHSFILMKDELFSIKKQLLQGFSPDDDAYPLGAPLFMETPRPCSPLAHLDFPDFDEVKIFSSKKEFIYISVVVVVQQPFSLTRVFFQVMPTTALADEEAFPEASGSQSDRKTSISINTLDILSVNQLLESVSHFCCVLFFSGRVLLKIIHLGNWY